MTTGRQRRRFAPTEREIVLLREGTQYGLSDSGGQYYRLGGHGVISLRFHPFTLSKMERRGWMAREQGVWRTTQLGRDALERAGTADPAR